MAIVTTDQGPNSAKITYDAGTTLSALMQAVEDYIVGHGWSLYDSIAGSNARAYRAFNKDGVTYKYFVLSYNLSGYLFCAVYESWNSTTHIGTNLAHYSDDPFYTQIVDLTNGGDMYIFSQNRYALFCSVVLGVIGSEVGNGACGCIEQARDLPEDGSGTGNIPPQAWASTYWLAMSDYILSKVRTVDGWTASNASLYSILSNGFGQWGPDVAEASRFCKFVAPTGLNTWNNKNWAFTLWSGHNGFPVGEYNWRGRIFHLKLTTRANVIPFMSDADVKVDSDGFYDVSGTNVEHWVLTTSQDDVRFLIPK